MGAAVAMNAYLCVGEVELSLHLVSPPPSPLFPCHGGGTTHAPGMPDGLPGARSRLPCWPTLSLARSPASCLALARPGLSWPAHRSNPSSPPGRRADRCRVGGPDRPLRFRSASEGGKKLSNNLAARATLHSTYAATPASLIPPPPALRLVPSCST